MRWTTEDKLEFIKQFKKDGTVKHVESVTPEDSQKVHGLQFVDNICSVIRLYKSQMPLSTTVQSFYSIIKHMIKETKY